jgi:hypothetical protein
MRLKLLHTPSLLNSTTVCAGMDFGGYDLNTGNGKVITGTFSDAVTSCQSYCFETYSTATGGFLVGSEASTSSTCWCKYSRGTCTTQSCYFGVGFYKGERPRVDAPAWTMFAEGFWWSGQAASAPATARI